MRVDFGPRLRPGPPRSIAAYREAAEHDPDVRGQCYQLAELEYLLPRLKDRRMLAGSEDGRDMRGVFYTDRPVEIWCVGVGVSAGELLYIVSHELWHAFEYRQRGITFGDSPGDALEVSAKHYGNGALRRLE